MKHKWWGGILAAMGMLALIIDSKTAISGAQEGILLCIQGVIPALMPFIFLSLLLVNALIGNANPVFSFLERILHIPGGSGSIYIAGLLGGYPTGAQLVSQAQQSGALSIDEANRMLSFCSNTGPAFLFGILSSAFSEKSILWILWVIQIISSLLVAQIIPGNGTRKIRILSGNALAPADALKKAVSTMAQICGWVVLFKVLGTFIERWFLFVFSNEARLSITGFLELTAGCVELAQIENEGFRVIIASGFLAFGGLCVAMQTASICSRLEMKYYIFGKIGQCLISIFLAAIVQFMLPFPSNKAALPSAFWIILPACIAIFVLFVRKIEKNSSISRTHSVQLVTR